MNRTDFFLIACSLFIVSCTSADKRNEGVAALNADSLLHNISILASDSFQGRMPFTQGEKMTTDFLRRSFEAQGLQPGNGDSYFQEVPMVNILAKADPTMEVKSKKSDYFLQAFNEYVIWTNKTDERITLENTPVVFAGYGVVAPEYNWNDYEGLDVKGKVVLVMVNDPGFWNGDTTLFKGRTMTYYGRWTYKFEEAARQGAKACFVIHRTSAAGYPFRVVQNGFNESRLQLDKRGKNELNCDAIGWIKDTIVEKLFKDAGYDSTLFEKANHRGFKAVPLNMSFSTSMKVQATYDKSKNVIGKITGSTRPDEVIIYTSHWDHLGVGKPDETGDSIYNGALDNASGIAGLLELARAFKSLTTPPGRTIVFLAVTGEEQGLLGSEYYTANPVYPINKTVAEINMDVLNNFGATKDVVVVGLGQSQLEDYLADEVKKAGRYVVGESTPETGGYFRSDHFNFAKVGIPALYSGSGTDIPGKGKVFGQQLKNEYVSKNYHRPSDELTNDWKTDGAIRDLQLLFGVGKRLAFESSWLQWKPTSEFKAVRDKNPPKIRQ
jgi:Zn-dependent M28 family amino/carboxypeptidase